MRHTCLILFIFCFISKTKAQNYLALADTAFEHQQYKEAIYLYKQYVLHVSKDKASYRELLAKCNFNLGTCYYYLFKTDSSVYFYKQALPFYRSVNNWVDVGQTHINITIAHKDARNFNHKWQKPIIKNETVKEVYFIISKVSYFDKDSMLVEINAGSNDGVINGIDAKCLGALKKDKTTDRTGWILANAVVKSVSENKTILKAKLYDNKDTMRFVYADDIASLYCKYSKSNTARLLQDLTALNICVLDNYKMQMYEWRDFLEDNDSSYENDILQKMKYDVKEIYDVVKDMPIYDTMYCAEGLFKGSKMTDALNKTTINDIRAFLQFVVRFPGTYAGLRFKFSEIYATWIINNCPASASSMIDYYIHQPNRSLKINYIENYTAEIYKYNYFDEWKDNALRDIKQNNFSDILPKLEMLKDAGYILKNEKYKSWYFYCNAKYFLRLKDTSAANTNFRKALSGFTSTNISEGVYLCNEALKQKNQNKIDIVLQSGHTGFFSLSFSPDGKYFVTGSTDKTIKLWDARLGKEILTVVAHDDKITSVSFSYDGRYIISTSSDETVKLWDADNLKLINTFNTGIYNSNAILSKNAETFIVCGKDSVIQQWSITENKMIKRFSKHKQRVYDICMGDNENEFYSCGADSFIYKWDIKNNDILRWYREKDRITGLQVSQDGRWMSSTLANGKLHVWDLNINQAVYGLDNLKSYTASDSSGNFFLCQPAFSSNSRYLLFGAIGHKFSIMELATGNYLTYNTSHFMDLIEIVMSEDGSFFATVGKDFKINLFDFQNYVFDPKYTMHKIEIEGRTDAGGMIAFDNSSSLLIYGSTLRKYNMITGKSEILIEYLSSAVRITSVFDKDKKNMVYVNYSNYQVIRCNIETKTFDTLFISKTKINEMDYDFNTGLLFLYDEEDRLLKVFKGKIVAEIKASLPDSAYRGLKYSIPSNHVFLAGYNFISVYDTSFHLITKIITDALIFRC